MLKKNRQRLLGVLCLFLFSSCSFENDLSSDSSSSSSDSTPSLADLYPYINEQKLIFTEFVAGTSPFERAVEVSNISSSNLDLSEYKIVILPKRNDSEKYEIELSGTLAMGESYVVVYDHDKVGQELKGKADLLSENLWNIGSYCMILLHKQKRVDILGYLGYSIEYATETSLVRKNEFMQGRESFDVYDWVNYHVDDYSHLGSKNLGRTAEDILMGPHLTTEDFSVPYFVSDSFGGGGVRNVSLNYNIDGDTTKFYLPSEFTSRGYYSSTSVRYLGIDTPEIQHGSEIAAMPWGYAAKNFTGGKLNNAKAIAIQSPKGSLTDNYGRLLCYVWYSDVSNPSPSDYKLLNNEIVYNGYSKVSHVDLDESGLVSDGISFGAYLSNSDNYAAKLGLKVHGEVDPDFDY